MGWARRYAVERTLSRVPPAHNAMSPLRNRPTCARTFVARPAQVNEAHSARRANHDDMRFMRYRNQKVERAHPTGLVEMFERALQGASHPPFFPHNERQPARDQMAVPNAEANLPPDIWRLCSVAIKVTLQEAVAASGATARSAPTERFGGVTEVPTRLSATMMSHVGDPLLDVHKHHGSRPGGCVTLVTAPRRGVTPSHG